jgi:hypothetical protein
MIRRIALTLCAAVLAGAASLPETASANTPTASAGKTTVASAHSAKRSGYIVASS